MKRITSFMASFGQFWLDVTNPLGPTSNDFPGLVIPIQASSKQRMVTHRANIGPFQVLYFVGFGARNITIKYRGKAVLKVAISI